MKLSTGSNHKDFAKESCGVRHQLKDSYVHARAAHFPTALHGDGGSRSPRAIVTFPNVEGTRHQMNGGIFRDDIIRAVNHALIIHQIKK